LAGITVDSLIAGAKLGTSVRRLQSQTRRE
jgi:hypothetical protein